MSLLIKELDKAQVKTEADQYSAVAVKSVQKLLDYEGQQDAQMLKEMGLATQLNYASEMKGRQMELESKKEMYAGKVFRKEAIQKLAMDYRLRFLKSYLYKGFVDVEIPAKIKEFAKLANLELTSQHLADRFFILAPGKAFNTEKVLIPKIEKQVDPLLFFQIDQDHYRLVHKWGADFTPFRALLGWKWRSEFNFFAFGFLVCFAMLSFLGSFVMYGAMVEHPFYFLLGCTVFSFFGAWIHYQSNVKNSNFIEDNLTAKNWDNAKDFY